MIDFDGIQNRVAKAPIAADNYSGLSAKTGYLLYAVGGAGYYGRQGDRTSTLKLYSLKDRKETTLAEDIRGYILADDGSKVLVAQGPGDDLEPLRCDTDRRSDAKGSLDVRVCLSIVFRRKSGTRSSTKCGDVIATGSTCRTCTARTGKRFANSTSRC